MRSLHRGFLVPCAAVLLLSAAAVAKRNPPTVTPVISDGIRYSAEGDGKDQFVVASEAATGHALWEVKIFHTDIKKFWKEEDSQWVFITNLKLADKSLFVKDEKARCYSVDLTTKRVKKQRCGNTFSP